MIAFLLLSLLAATFQTSLAFIRGQPQACPQGQRIVAGDSGFHCCNLIPFCEDSAYFCPSPGNHYCTKCMHNVDANKIAYKLSDDRKTCQRLCSWRTESMCFPGTCSDGMKSSCVCAPGFTNPENGCHDVAPGKHINSCTVKITHHEKSGQELESQLIHCDPENKLKKVPITMQVNNIHLQFQAQFKPDLSKLVKPYYIQSYSVGLLQADLGIEVERVNGGGMTSKTICESTYQPTNEISCQSEKDLGIGRVFKHGDRIIITPLLTIGGSIIVRDYENGLNFRVDKIPNFEVSSPIELLYDFLPPEHCSVRPQKCDDPLIDFGSPAKRTRRVDMKLHGWFDDSGIKEYEYEFYKMQPYGDELGYADKDLFTKGVVAESPDLNVVVILKDPGVYCVQIMVMAYDGRYKRARRFFIFDNKSEVKINPNAKVIVRDSASTLDASTYWQGNKNSVTLNVNGRFKNQDHIHSKYLNPIKESNLPIEQGYEERTGQPPLTRSMEAVASDDGIIEFKAGYNKDKKGGKTLTSPLKWENMGSREEFTLPINAEDGDSVRVWFQGLDVVGNMKEDSVLIHIDSTGPKIDNFLLKRSYETYYGVHQSEELHGLTFEFAVFDPESGLASLSWQLIDVFRQGTVLGEGSLPIKKEAKNKCDIYTCACVETINECYIIFNEVTLDSDKLIKHQGQHDFDYRITVKATNQAGIEATQSFKFTIDITAPEPGSVFDAPPDGSDVDFQQDFTLHGSWDGFFDRESSILYYRYAVLNKCADKSILLGPNSPVVMQRTAQRFASITVTEPGKYYFNVIGYNKGESPSDTGCSDGVVIDNTPPVIKDIIIRRALVKPGLIQTRDGQVWLINKNRQKILIPNPPESCRTNALTVEDASSWPEGEHVEVTEEDCPLIGAASQNIYLPSDHELIFSWTGEDLESGIYDFEVGLSSSADSLVPDIRSYSSTSSHSTYTAHHLNLHGGQIFYIFIKAINRAQMTTLKVMGPMVIDLTAPEILPKIKMTVKYKEVKNEDGFILASWHHENILDPESGEYFHYEFAIGSTFGGTDIHSFTPADPHLEHQYCRKKLIGSCVAIPLSSLSWQLHDHHEYFILIKVFNAAGLAGVVSSPSYFHYSLPPSPGHVYEISQQSYSHVDQATASDDVDFQTDNHNVWVRWSGFANPHEQLTYKVGLGSKPELDDIVAFQPVSADHHYFSNLNLETFKKYYVTVEAENRVGPVTVSSDGIMILPANPVELNFKVFDGPPCHTDSASSTCHEDIEFASSSSVVDGHWEIPEQIAQYFTHIEWSVERKEPSVNNWLMVRDFENVHASSFGHAAGLSFHNNDNLRIVVKFCHPDGCYQPVYSNGFWIITEPPVQEDFTLVHFKDNLLTAMWKPWTQSGLESLDTFSHYEWNVLSFDGGLLVPWQEINAGDIHLENGQVLWKTEFHIAECARLGIRGFNKVGLYSTEHSRLPECYRKKETTNFVLDAIGDWDEKTKTLSKVAYDPSKGWLEDDVDYTPSNTMISAVWPNLRHGNFYWKIVSDKAIRDWKYSTGADNPLTFFTYADSSPEVLASGHTTDRFINVEELTLQHGQRYYVCVHASTVRLTYSNHDEILETVSNCSDGVVVDLTAPLPGKVVAGFKGKNYQSSTTDFFIYWKPFVDVEEHGVIPHSTGIKAYYYTIGSFPGKSDVTKYTFAGFSNTVHVHGLELQGGQRYYASIKAVDFAGHYTIVHSAGVVVDVTPPVITDSKIVIGGLGRSSYQTTSTISATWKNVFIDPESDISSYEWCVGTSPNYCDIMAFQQTILPEGSYGSNLNVFDGQTYYVSVKAYNHAGLSTITSSWSIIVDTSPPACGTVHDGAKSDAKIDVNYKVDVTSLSAHWEGFNDPHTPIVSYFVGVGTCPNCHNFLEFSDVGLHDEISWSGLKLALGQKYYITVKACNAAELCCTTSSDGVISDNTPPNAGLVFDGLQDEDLQWQFSRYFISAHWMNFHDVHSGLSHYEWRAGTTPGAEDVFRHKRIHLEESFFIVHLKKEMPVSYYIHITVRAYNKVGLYCEKSSNGFRIDVSEPIIRIPIEFDTKEAGATYQNYQFWRSSLKVKWHFVDFESPIQKQYISVFTHQNSYLHFPTLELPGSDREYQFTNLKMNDGDQYIIRVIACNQAKLCNHSDTERMLIDGSPPKSGVFASATDRAIPLPYGMSNWMCYIRGHAGKPELKLAWLSFSDPHSEILFYIVGVGSSMYSLDLKQNFPLMVDPKKDENLKTEDGYYIQTTSFFLENEIITGAVIYVTVWAENRVGLRSVPLHGSFVFEDVPGTYRSPLILVRNCQAHSCKGHCACAGESHLCPYLEKTCVDVTGQPGYPQIRVLDVLNMHLADQLIEVYYTPSTCTLSARWVFDKNEPGVKIPYHYDYTIGVDDEPPGSAFKSSEQVWFDNLWFDKVIVTPQRNPGQKDFLQPNRLYKFYVRAWYDENTYAIYSSNGVRSDSTPPERTQLGRVRELSQQNLALDIDILTSSDQISWSWANAFKDDQSEIIKYRFSLSSFPGGEDTMHYQGNIEPQITLRKLNSLLSGVRYYLNVIAVNQAGLLSSALSSNGFIIDKDPPVTGSVLDGIGLTDISHQNSSNVAAASWHGFYDLHSYIHHYLWCVGSTRGAKDILPCVNVGLRQSSSRHIPAKSFSNYFSSVIAVDGAGHKSNPANSDGVIVDLTPPQSKKTFTFGPNLIRNPSFEKFDKGIPNFWDMSGRATQLTSINKPYLNIKGIISQRIATEPGHYYCVTLSLAHPTEQKIESLGQITIPGLQKIFSLREKKGSIGFKGDDEVEWSPQVFYFVASQPVSVIAVESVGVTSTLFISSISVQHIQPIESANTENTVYANLIIGPRYHAVYSHWEIIDPESGIKEFLWAIGTVKGGTQLQGFKSVGSNNYAYNDSLILSHKSHVFVTVVAENNAGLKTVRYSNPLKVLLRPPEICCVSIGDTKENHYQKSFAIQVHWQVLDKDSAVTKCLLALGTKGNYQDIQRYRDIGITSPVSANLPTSLQHGTELYATIRCENSAGLSSQNTSQTVVMVTSAPRSNDAVVLIGINSLTHYPQRGNHQSYTDSLDVSWTGFSNIHGIQNYEVRVADRSGRDIVPWVSTRVPWKTSIKLRGLKLISNQAYQVFVRAINYAGLPSDAASAMVTIETANPQVQPGRINSRWQGRDLDLSWSGKFMSQSSLIYEVCIGSHPSGNDILRWTETKNTQIRLNNLNVTREYHVVITAINEAGLFSTENHVILHPKL